MAGRVVVSTLNNDTGVLATQNGMTGIARAWVNFDGGNTNTAGTINGSFNVSSITVNGTGDFTVNFTTAMPNANYSVQCSGQRENTGSNVNLITNVSSNGGANSILAGSVRVGSANDGGTSVVCYKYCVAVHSS
jgi:hypothetical protein